MRGERDRQAVFLRDLPERVEQIEVREPPIHARRVRDEAAASARALDADVAALLSSSASAVCSAPPRVTNTPGSMSVND